MLIINKEKKELNSSLDSFIWDFKIGDNILYNLDIIYQLVVDYNNNKNYIDLLQVVNIYKYLKKGREEVRVQMKVNKKGGLFKSKLDPRDIILISPQF